MDNQQNIEKLDMTTPNITDENVARIAELFPNVVTEGRDENGKLTHVIDFDALKQELSDSIVEGPQERYRLDWPGKREAMLAANTPITKTLRPVREESVDFDTTKNLFIEGDNLDALKLLQETYLGKVKMIYIDPPYNTGKDFIYKDNFTGDKQDYLEDSGQVDEEGGKLVANPESNGRYHSDWLTMMYPRLKLARNLLRDDGIIFISIGNQEFTNLRKSCDAIFGRDNFVECITWNKRIPKNDKGVGNIHDFVLVYTKSTEIRVELRMRKDGLDEVYDLLSKSKRKNKSQKETEAEIKKLYKKRNFDRGITLYNSVNSKYELWGKINMSWPNSDTNGPRYAVLHPKTLKEVKIPDRGWRWKKETFDQAAGLTNGHYTSIEELHDGSYICGKIWFAADENTQPSSITFLDDVNYFLLRSILSFKSDGGVELERYFDGKSFFSNPKPTKLMKALISSVNMSDNDIVLDFYAGSSTSADAVLRCSSEDGVKRCFIMVQLPQKTAPTSEAFKSGYEDISKLSMERIRRAGNEILDENPDQIGKLDVGFRVLKIDNSNMNDVYYTPGELEQGSLLDAVDHIKPDRTAEDLLFQVMLDWGVDLSLPIVREEIGDKTVFWVGEDDLAACFDLNISEDVVKVMAERKPLRAVFRDDGFGSDDMKINAGQLFAQMTDGHTDMKVI